MLGKQCLATAMLIALVASLTAGMIANAQNSDTGKVVNVASDFLKASFPEVWKTISNATPKVRQAQTGEYGEALSGFPTYVVKWSDNGVDVSVLVTLVDGEVVPVGVEATINGQASEESSKLVYELGDKILSEVKALYNELTREAVSNGDVEIIGFQIHVNGTPVAFIEPTKPSIIPATLSWNTYFVKSVLAFEVFNDYPLVKAAMNNAGKNALAFKVSMDEAKAILSKHKELGNVSRIDKYVLIANETARPAYVVTLGPWNTAVVYADNGEFLPIQVTTTRTTSPTTTSVPTPTTTSNSWNLPIPPQYFPYFLSGVAMAVTAIIGIIVIRVVTRKK